MQQKRLTNLENFDNQALAASVLLFDKIEIERFITLFSKTSIIDYNLKHFVDVIVKLHATNVFDSIPKDLQERIKYISGLIDSEIKAIPNASTRDKMTFWFNSVKTKKITPKLAEDLLYQYCWAEFLHTCALADSDTMSYKDKLSLRPHIPDLDEDNIKPISDIVIDDSQHKTFKTGVDDLDHLVSMEESNFVVIAAPTSVGKSLFMLNQAIVNAKQEKVLYVSLEENEQEIKKRIINNAKDLNIEEKNNINSNFFLFCPSTSNPNIILPTIEDKIKSLDIHVVFIDYIQLLKIPDLAMFESLRETTRMLKIFAISNNILLVTASQIRRDAEIMGQSLSSLFGSSTLEHDANCVLLLESKAKDKVAGPVAMKITVAKNRAGATGEIQAWVNYANGRILAENNS